MVCSLLKFLKFLILTCSHIRCFSKITEKPIDMFPRTDYYKKMACRHQFHQLKPCGDGSIDVKAVSLYFTRFPEVHPSCLLNLKVQNTYMETNRRLFLR